SNHLSHQEDDDLLEALTDHIAQRQHFWTFQDDDNDRISLSSRTESRLSKRSAQISVEGERYVIRLQKYFGILKNDHIKQGNLSVDNTYYVIAFANVTPIHNWLTGVNIVLMILLAVIGTVLFIFIQSIARQITDDIDSLTTYLGDIGVRRKGRVLPLFRYQEFQSIGKSAFQMDDLIRLSQESQKLFFQNVSHELRTPLTSIQGYSEGLKTGLINDSQKAFEMIYQESLKMSRLIDDILILSKIEADPNKLHIEKLSLNDFLYDLLWQFDLQIKSRNLELILDFSESYCDIRVDESLFERAISNIINNALRYAKQKITISYVKSDNDLILTIGNDGPIIQTEELKYIFDRFYKGDGGNFGIGLSMTKEIIEQHRGSITVTSSQEVTEFNIILPQY
ncbi:sensor histidine kinase, partial [Streptococcus pluranimalium]|uniref:sensor histidine kinase n=1 Tax=Streptococcus pluranimalium TaxID=82348 RepID=UPI0039FD4613